MKTRTEIRRENTEFFSGLQLQANCMRGAKVPKHYWIPSINRMITAGQYANILRIVRGVFKQNPEQEIKQSFQSWAPTKVKHVIRWEIIPSIHERINVRGLMK